jgi:hypothetical protein
MNAADFFMFWAIGCAILYFIATISYKLSEILTELKKLNNGTQ